MRRGIVLVVLVLVVAWLLRAACSDADGGPAPVVPAQTTAPAAAPRPKPPRARAAPPAEEPAPTPPAEVKREPRAPSPPPVGEHAIRIEVADDATQAPVAAIVRLWRLGAPADGDWTAGDLIQQGVEVPVTGATASGLPAGTYRIEVLSARIGAEDPPAFTVPETTAVRVTASMPRPRPVRCLVLDADGVPVPRATATSLGTSRSGTRDPAPPAWASPRRIARDESDFVISGGGFGGHGGGRVRRTLAANGPRGEFVFEDMAESSRAEMRSRSDMLTWDGRTSVVVVARSGELEGPDFLAVAVPLERVASHIVLPDGRTAVAAGATVTGTCHAMRLDGAPPSGAWRTIAVTVNVALEGYESAKYEWSLAGEPWPVVTMTEAKPVEAAK